jgi:hypothetical protein
VLLDMEARSGVETVEIEFSRIADVRSRIPTLRHRRPIGAPEIAA